MERKKCLAFGLMIVLVTSIVFISGCVQEDSPLESLTDIISDPVIQEVEPCISEVVFDDVNLRKQAASIVSGCPSGDKECQVNRIYRYVVENFDYYSDPRSREFIQSPSETMNIKGGDCEDLTILLMSLLENLGI
ncbi:MAG: transglutaminase domain-containing protein, partial [Methanophagales archaeon]|nr:transglutaminase domain-containing protein [Methanophagales archaeon]